jgi:cell division protein FtsN
MTLSINGNDIGEIVQIAATVGSIVATLVIGFIVYLMVRPSKAERARRKALPPAAADPRESEEMWRVMDRMEERLEVLERALADRIERPRRQADEEDRLFAPADQGRDSGRK